jgi:hypothetical protein
MERGQDCKSLQLHPCPLHRSQNDSPASPSVSQDFVGQERVEELTKQILWSTGVSACCGRSQQRSVQLKLTRRVALPFSLASGSILPRRARTTVAQGVCRNLLPWIPRLLCCEFSFPRRERLRAC